MDRRGRPSLTERGILRPVPADRAVPAGPASRPAAPAPRAARHCWVADPPGVPGLWPGLLTEWRRADAGWQGLVCFAAVVGGRSMLLQDWVDAARLRPVPR